MLDLPLLFQPIVKTQVWGGDFLRSRAPDAPATPCGESWEITDHGADSSVIRNGPLAGRTLHAALSEVCGPAVDPASPGVFPLMLKIIDPKSDLSVQVHPDDAYANAQKPGELGKTEAWYVVEAAPGGRIYHGLRPGVTRERFAAAIKDGTVAACLREVTVAPGDVYYIPSGTVHALGGGVRILEIQQNSDTTYRVFDWNRVGLDGKPRALHVDHALAVTDFSGRAPDAGARDLPARGCHARRAIASPKFNFDVLDGFTGVYEGDTAGKSFHIVTVASGRATVATAAGQVALDAYSSCLVPYAAGKYTVAPAGEPAALKALVFSK